ncbi:hypothetical protein BaRGS_00011878 [Batillaria attramentaria]|uniref:Uncharacterized protein n=1 Tax=Batillaria attramentaria TaxID=370345 RepID=A0ABD0LBW7_9CAEN
MSNIENVELRRYSCKDKSYDKGDMAYRPASYSVLKTNSIPAVIASGLTQYQRIRADVSSLQVTLKTLQTTETPAGLCRQPAWNACRSHIRRVFIVWPDGLCKPSPCNNIRQNPHQRWMNTSNNRETLLSRRSFQR